MRDWLIASLRESGRNVGASEEALINRAITALKRARLCARWLRREGDALPLERRIELLDREAAAADTFAKAVAGLGLGDQADPWAQIDAPAPGGAP